ncbi:MAG TPA: hypothetical protein DCL54_01455 [Alphaproteobacteria bacterium]|nr:hypothetical protein [Alphaproteobacteria bacterium]HAJ45232.1 hypothetical protein [Alphaproteobacteria bacterium]
MGATGANSSGAAALCRVHLHRAWDRAPAPLLRPGLAPTPFQTASFLSAWHGALGGKAGHTPLILEVQDLKTARPVMLWPLVAVAVRGLREIRFADACVSDNNAPLCEPGWLHATDGQFPGTWAHITRALPPADLIRLEKMPGMLGPSANPILTLRGAERSRLHSNEIGLGDDFDAYFGTLPSKFLKNQRRLWRVFERAGGTHFRLARDVDDALEMLSALSTLQAQRMSERGCDYVLDEPEYVAFYQELLRLGVPSGEAVIGALYTGEEPVAVMLGVNGPEKVTFLRIANRMGEWAPCSLGRLVMEKMFRAVHAQGVRRIDMSIGDCRYKDEFGLKREPLYELLWPLTWRGRAYCAARKAAQAWRQSKTRKAISWWRKAQTADENAHTGHDAPGP